MKSDPPPQTLQSEASSSSGTKRGHLQRHVALGALFVAMGTMASRILGLVREVVLAAYFPRFVTDAFFVAWRLPNMFRRLLGEGALSVSFIPVFIDCLNGPESDPKRARELASGVFTLLLTLTTILSAFAIIYMEPLLNILAPGEAYQSVEGKVEATIRYSRLVFCFLILITTYALYTAILNSLKKFALPALVPALLNVVLILGALLPQSWFPFPGDGLALSVLVGGVIQFAFLIPTLIRLQFLPKFTTKILSQDVFRVFRTAIPGLIGMSILQITTFFNVRFASELPEGSQSWIYWADRLVELPLSLFAVSLGSVLLPTLSEYVSRKNFEALSESSNYQLRLVICFTFPVAFIMYLLASPLVELIFLRGEFGESDLLATASILEVYALVLISSSLVRVVVPSYYAVKNTWFPATASLIALFAHLFMAPLLMKEMGVAGLALSTALSATINLFLLLMGFSPLITRLRFMGLAAVAAKVFIATLAMGAFLKLFAPIYLWVGRGSLKLLFLLTVMVPLGLLLFYLVSRMLQIKEVEDLFQPLFRKIRGKIWPIAK